MAAIDRIYLNSYEEYIQFRDWLKGQPKVKDKFGEEVSLMDYFIGHWKEIYWKASLPVFTAAVQGSPRLQSWEELDNHPLNGVQKNIKKSKNT